MERGYMIYFSWIPPGEIFDAEKHTRNDEQIFHLNLIHEEGKPAKLSIMIDNPNKKEKILDKKWGLFAYKEGNNPPQCFFSGFLSYVTKSNDEHFLTLVFIAQSAPLEKEWPAISANLKQKPFYDELFDKTSGTAESVLAGYPLTLYWDRITGKLALSHAFDAEKNWDLTELCSPKDVSFHMEDPVSCVDVTISAQWIQHITGYIDIAPAIALQFRDKVINTFTGKAFFKSWPKTGAAVGHSGYRVLYSYLKEITPPFLAPLRRHKSTLKLYRPIQNLNPWKNKLERVLIKRSWFTGELIVGKSYRQKRQEDIHFKLNANLPAGVEATVTKKISLSLKKIVQYDDLPYLTAMSAYKQGEKIQYQGKVYEARHEHVTRFNLDPLNWKLLEIESDKLFASLQNSFFTTLRGRQAFEHALERAKTCLTWGTRCFYVQVVGKMQDFSLITLNDTVSIRNAKLPNGRAKGKVVKYNLSIDGKTGNPEVQITFACCVGEKSITNIVAPAQPTYALNYATEDYQRHINATKTSNGVTYLCYADQRPADLFKDLIYCQIENMLRTITIKNSPEEQEEALKDVVVENLTSEKLKEKETKVYIEFQRIQSCDCLTNTIEATVLTSWFENAKNE